MVIKKKEFHSESKGLQRGKKDFILNQMSFVIGNEKNTNFHSETKGLQRRKKGFHSEAKGWK